MKIYTRNRKNLKKGRIHVSLPDRNYKRGGPPGIISFPPDTFSAHPAGIKSPPLPLQFIRIQPNSLHEEPQAKWSDVSKSYNKEDTFWLNIDDIKNEQLLKDIGQFFSIDNLTLEDITTTDQRPKVEDHGHYLFFTLRMFRIEGASKKIISEQVAFIMGKNYLISFQEGPPGDVFDNVRNRMRKSEQCFKRWKSDYLFYALTDSIIDNYFCIIDILFDELDGLEKELIYNKNSQIMENIYEKKIEIMFIRRYFSPLKDCINSLLRMENHLIHKDTTPYLKDLQDHILQLSESIDSFRETLSFLAEFTLSFSSNSTNEIMKFLTIFTSIFIPLNFIAGVYGMNFQFMPELGWKYGYALALGLMIVMATGLIYYFRRRKWL